MDGCLAVDREVDKFLSKLSSFNHSVNRNLVECGQLLDRSKSLSESDQYDKAMETVSKVKSVAQTVANDHKDLHSSISKIGKSVDKNFVASDPNIMHVAFMESEQKQTIANQVVCDYLLRQGHLEAVRSLIQEAKVPVRDEQMHLFVRVNEVIDALRNKNILPAIQFVEDFRFQLSSVNSSLEFHLLRLRFLEMVAVGNRLEALSLSTHFSKFTPQHTPEIQKLMGHLIYSQQRSEDSNSSVSKVPVSLQPDHVFAELVDLLTSDLCSMLGFSRSHKSHLLTCVEAGCQFLPSLINLKQVMTQGKVGNLWNAKEELPIEVNVRLSKYHSLVACPVLRQPLNDDNPAMRLVCGHIISREALNRIASNHSKMKCPYCPFEQSAKMAVVIKF